MQKLLYSASFPPLLTLTAMVSFRSLVVAVVLVAAPVVAALTPTRACTLRL